MFFIHRILYNFLVMPVIYIGVRVIALFNKKIRRGIRGRSRLFEELVLNAARLDKSKSVLWFHSASLGEFEQAKPIIEELRKNNSFNILVTFFSPSGYDNSRKYPHADLISYIPFDTVSAADRFVQIVKPAIAVFMRYDFWPNLVWRLGEKKIPMIIADATMQEKTKRLWPYVKSFHVSIFRHFDKILTVSSGDIQNFKRFGIPDNKLAVAGDTRFDRVYTRSLASREQNILRTDITEGKKVIVIGSSWHEDEEILIPVLSKLLRYHKDLLVIIAPHEPTVDHLEKLESDFEESAATIRFSLLNNYKDQRVLLVDSIGILVALYSYADIAFVGGSFKSNVHNVLEAAVYGIPVLYGPKIYNSQEAFALADTGGGIIVRNDKEAYIQFSRLLNSEEYRGKSGKSSGEFVSANRGATERIIKEIYSILNSQNRLLPYL